jgi:hypothetical protein
MTPIRFGTCDAKPVGNFQCHTYLLAHALAIGNQREREREYSNKHDGISTSKDNQHARR